MDHRSPNPSLSTLYACTRRTSSYNSRGDILIFKIAGVIGHAFRDSVLDGLCPIDRCHQRGGKKKALRTICNFLEKNKHRMRYDEYLRLGFPVATGVIEGACRHVIKDRMERAGMRWKVPGAQAMLNLRTIYTNGDWTAYQDFRIDLENEWLYPNTKAFEAREWDATQAA